MNRILTGLLTIFLFPALAFAQTSQADMDKIMKQAQTLMGKNGNDTSMMKMMKNLQDQQKQVTAAMKNNPAGSTTATTSSLYGDPSDYGNVDNWRFPAKNTALLSSLPKKIFTRAELVSFLNDIYAQLSKKLTPGVASSVQSIAARYNNNGSRMGDAAIYGWYTKYREESLLLIIKAAATSPDDGLLLNNCAAILNMSGIEEKAVPILKYILQSYPGDGMVLNNLGQAYAGLGETDTAMVYLGRSIKVQPENPEANNTAGQIEATKGNTGKAVDYFEKSIKSAYTKTAQLKLSKIKKDAKIAPLIRPRVKIPEYFNQFKYKLPAQCTSTDNAVTAEAEHRAFKKMITDQVNQIGKGIAASQQRKYTEAMAIMNANGKGYIVDKGAFIAQPYYGLCGIMSNQVTTDYGKDLTDLGPVDKKYYADIKSLNDEYEAKLKVIQDGFKERADRCCGEGKAGSCCPTAEEQCKAFNTLANQYLPKFAVLTEDWQEKNKLVFTTHYDEVMYWGYLTFHPVSDDDFRLQIFYPIVTQYLLMLSKIGTTMIIKPCEYDPITATADSNSIKEMDCPLDIQIPFGIGKIALNCKRFSVSGGEGAVFAYERDFTTHQSTVSVGIGLKLELGVKLGPIKGGVSAGATETAFITFDGKNGVADAGLKNEAKVSGGATGIGKDETSIGSTLGINSGWNFNEGPFKGKIGPAPETPINKNVQVYKPR